MKAPDMATLDLPDISAYGMEWTLGEVMKDGMDLGWIPIPFVEDVYKFTDKLAQFAHSAINGSNSIRVGCQRIGRDMKWKNRSVPLKDIAQAEIAWMQGVRTTRMTVVEREVRIYVASDGSEFTDKDELLEYEKSL